MIVSIDGMMTASDELGRTIGDNELGSIIGNEFGRTIGDEKFGRIIAINCK
jgi:hypothetical protein